VPIVLAQHESEVPIALAQHEFAGCCLAAAATAGRCQSHLPVWPLRFVLLAAAVTAGRCQQFGPSDSCC
jgi:hypothetical protein